MRLLFLYFCLVYPSCFALLCPALPCLPALPCFALLCPGLAGVPVLSLAPCLKYQKNKLLEAKPAPILFIFRRKVKRQSERGKRSSPSHQPCLTDPLLFILIFFYKKKAQAKAPPFPLWERRREGIGREARVRFPLSRRYLR